MNKYVNSMLVTCAFPYANGDIHLGHLLEHIQADIWVRYFKMQGRSVFFICADDTHGTAIMLQAQKINISPEKFIYDIQRSHQQDLLNFSILYDHYSSTHSNTNKYLCNDIYKILLKKKLIIEKKIYQLYDIKLKMFLSDRLVQGTCPKCNAQNQYGDNCDCCGAIYDATELLNAISVLSNSIPHIKSSKHLFFKLSFFSRFLKQWINSGVIQKPVLKKLNEWLLTGLNLWNISRDKPYFGFKIPGYKNKFFYVWLDAPVGYISCFQELCHLKKINIFNDVWSKDSKHELYHFIGKDIIYFHNLFWPAILKGCGYRTPTKIFVHGYVTFKGLKLSKSKGSVISAKKWLSYFDSDSLRYYFASKSSNNIEDIDINLYDYAYKINSDIVNNIINLASRNASFLKKYFSNVLSGNLIKPTLYTQLINESLNIERLFEKRKFSCIIQKIRFLSHSANKYISKKKPWLLIKNSIYKNKVHDLCSFGIYVFKILMTFLKPITPELVKKTELFLNTTLLWMNVHRPLLNHKINDFFCLYNRISMSHIHDFLNNI